MRRRKVDPPVGSGPCWLCGTRDGVPVPGWEPAEVRGEVEPLIPLGATGARGSWVTVQIAPDCLHGIWARASATVPWRFTPNARAREC